MQCTIVHYWPLPERACSISGAGHMVVSHGSVSPGARGWAVGGRGLGDGKRGGGLGLELELLGVLSG